MFQKAKVNWRQWEIVDGIKTALVVNVVITDSEKGEKAFTTRIEGDELDLVINAQDSDVESIAFGLVKSQLRPKYESWTAQPVKTNETIDGNPEFTSLD
jgi:hypothetical protein